MNTPDVAKLPGLQVSDNGPVFNEPWEASAFALAVGLHENGLFGWDEWAEVLGETISQDEENRPYYELWLAALETISAQKSLTSKVEISKRKTEWQNALLATPHGQPVRLENAG